MPIVNSFPVVREINLTPEYLQKFESRVAEEYEAGGIKGPVHLSDGNEEQLIDIFSRVSDRDFVFSAWRNHYHALLHGIDEAFLFDEIRAGRSMGIMCDRPAFFSSSIVGGIIPIALGVALGLSQDTANDARVWCFIGDMTYETGLFWEAYKFSQNRDLPITFVVEDNGKSVTTDTVGAWKGKMPILDGVLHYEYTSKYPHHGTGKWVNF